jgi:lipopolysaccharide heptosyltransferase II
VATNPDSAVGTEPPRLLVRGVNWLGDAVMTTPALIRLRERFPQAHIALLTPSKLAPLWTDHPAFNTLLTRADDEGSMALARRLAREHFDTALVLPNSPRSAIEVWLAGIPRRVGYARSWRNWFLTQAVPARSGGVRMVKRSVRQVRRLAGERSPAAAGQERHLPPSSNPVFQAHQANDYLHLAAVLGANPAPVPVHLRVTPEEVESVRKKFELDPGHRKSRPVFGLNPGAEYGPAKRWPAERFIAAAQAVRQQTGCTWLILGAPQDRELARRIEVGLQSGPGASASELAEADLKNLAGETTLRELMALLRLCRVLLTNDTGPMHIAAALGTPVVVPFGSTSPQLTGPGYGGDSRHQLLQAEAACAPCFRRTCPLDFRCMTGINPENVAQAVVRAGAF